MTTTEHLLLCLSEECVEVAHRVSKALRFGISEVQRNQTLNNAQRIRSELDDLMAVIELLDENGIISKTPDPSAISAKKAKVLKYLDYAREEGTVQ